MVAKLEEEKKLQSNADKPKHNCGVAKFRI